MPLILTALLWAVSGEEDLLVDYEDAVLARVPSHGGRVVERVRRVDPADGPFEVQVIEFPGEDALAAYLVDPVRVARSGDQARAIARTELIRVVRVGVEDDRQPVGEASR